MRNLEDRFETADGSRPDPTHLDAAAKQYVLSAFQILSGGDAFEQTTAEESLFTERAQAYLASNITIKLNSMRRGFLRSEKVAAEHRVRIEADIVQQLSYSKNLVERMLRAKPIRIDVVPENTDLHALGFPPRIAQHASGLFWNVDRWKEARIGLSAKHLVEDPSLVFHEMAHAIHYLGMTKAERDVIYKFLRPTFGSRAAMDEVFAIYSERELTEAGFGDKKKNAPGVYGFTRRQWDENHIFTRFCRKLYFPARALAGPKGSRGGWSAFRGE